MADYTSLRKNIQTEEVDFQSSVSEATAKKLAGSINFINNRQHTEKQFFANGRYGIMSSYPQIGVDGLVFFEFNATIINVWAFNLIVGSSGTTEMDVKRATSSGGAFTTIFSTTPKFTSASANNSYVDANGYQAPTTGVTAPVLSITNVDQGDALRFDLISAMGGFPENCGIIIHYQPR